MKKVLVFSILAVALVLTGCSGLLHRNQGVIGKASQQTQAIQDKIEALEDKQSDLNDQKLTHIGAWSAGVDYSLDKETNQTPPVITAREINKRVEALANKPDYKELQEVYGIINNLLTNQVTGEKMLAKKDQQIEKMNSDFQNVIDAKNTQLELAAQQSAKNAATADQYKATLGQMDSFWGFGAIKYGLSKFIHHALWVIAILILIYVALRIAAAFNPIAAGIFGVFDALFSGAVHCVRALAPNAITVAGFVPASISDEYKATLTLIVDAVEIVQDRALAAKTVATVQDVLTELKQSKMTEGQQAIIDDIKKKLNWK